MGNGAPGVHRQRVSARARSGLLGPESWQRKRLAVVVTIAATFLGLEFSSSFIPLYVRYLGVNDVGEAALWSGLVVGVAPLAAALMAPVWGSLADRYGRKRMVLRALVAISVLSFAMGAVPDVGWAFITRLVLGITSGLTGMAMALAVSISPRERVGQTVGMMQAAQMLPLAVGPPIGGAISDALGLRANFHFTGVVVALALLVLVFLFGEEPPAAAPPSREAKQRTGRWGLAGLPGFAATMVLVFLVQFVDRSLMPILPLYLGQINTPPAQLATISGLVVAAGAVAAGTSATIYGRLAGPGRTWRLLLVAVVGGALCVGPLALVDRWEQVLVLRPLLGLLAGGSLAMGYTLGTRLVPPERTGLALGVLSSSGMIGSASAPFLAGLVGRFDLRAVFAVDVLCYLLAVVVVLVWLRRVDRAAGTARASS
jgi:MFS transporter, DHA1 family, multidrug resistance protein